MPDSNKYIHVYTKTRTGKLKRKKGKKEMLLDSNPHLLSSKDSLLSIRLSRNCDFISFIIVIVTHSKAHILRRLPKIGRKVIEYAYVSGQCIQIIPGECRLISSLSEKALGSLVELARLVEI